MQIKAQKAFLPSRKKRYGKAKVGVLHLLTLFLSFVLSVSPLSSESISIDLGNSSGSMSGRILQLFLLMTALSLGPSLVVMVTSFTRFVVVFSFLRSALGTQQSPPNMVLTGLSLFLTLFVMQPTFEKIYEQAIKPLMAEKIKEDEALVIAGKPLHQFMLKNVRPRDLELFFNIAKAPKIEKPEETPFRLLIPAFMISELKKAFEIGFLIFMPFLIIDLVVSCILMAMGMMMIPPTMIALPFKIIFFVVVDGWYMICGSLANSFK